ncbi:uncharacterized protein [Epargyreus clarus]|uniref:uncharacterized protein n=1 Tax=Epargyreus clarus TaxID=520877 RepID=UPI003C2CF2D2
MSNTLSEVSLIRTFDRRNRCINCSFLIPRNQRRHPLEQAPSSIINILQSWITPTQLSPGSIICTECSELLTNQANTRETVLTLPAFGHRSVCFPCGNSILRARRTYSVQDRQERNILLRLVPLHLVSRMTRVCAACWRSATREVQRQQQHDSNRPHLEDLVLSGNSIPDPPPLPPLRPHIVPEVTPKVTSSVYRRAANTSGHCIFVNCFEPERLLIPSSLKELLLYKNKFYVPAGARVCQHHLDNGPWHELTSQLRDFTGRQFDNILNMMQRANSHTLDFSNISTMPTHLCNYWLGMNSGQFHELLNCVPNLAEEVPNAIIALCIYLVKLRTGDSNERLATLFKKPRSTLERLMTNVRNCLVNNFVPLYLGFNHMTVEDVAFRNRIIPEGIFGNPEMPPHIKPAIVICDATYVFLQSSSNYLFQKETYSLQKLDNLVKPFMIVCCDGYIVECLGPYKATSNDASITSLNLRNEESCLRSFFRRGDVFIVDKGFRDVINELQGHGFVTYMPESLLENERQLTTEQANRSRLVTMCRWVIEVVNGRVKRDFRLFRHVFNNRAAMHLKDDFRISCALLNKFHIVIDNPPEALEYVTIAKSRLSLVNHLATYVEQENINRRRVCFQTIDSNNPHLDRFPRLTISDLKRLALGTYQMKQARSYYGEHVRQSGMYSVEINNELDDDVPLVLGLNNYLLRGRIKSRHVNSRTYYTYLLLSKDDAVANTLDAIVGYYCSCLVGKRTVGCCAHVMTVV